MINGSLARGIGVQRNITEIGMWGTILPNNLIHAQEGEGNHPLI